MTTDSTTPADETTLFLGKAWSDPIEAAIRDRVRVFIEELIEEELAAALGADATNGGIGAARQSRARSSPATDHRPVRNG